MSEFFYCRVSSKDQNLARQLVTARQYKDIPDCNVFCDKQSGKDFAREKYRELKAKLTSGDEVIVKELDRLGRNKEEIKSEIAWFKDSNVSLRILDVPTTLIDFQGQEWIRDMVNNILIEVLGAMAEQEREKTLRRQREGIDAMPIVGGKRISLKKGVPYGRKPYDVPNFESFATRVKKGELTVSGACDALGISRSKWYRLSMEQTRSI